MDRLGHYLQQKEAMLGDASEREEAFILNNINRQFESSASTGIYPRQLAIETVNHCNAECVMCPYPNMNRHKGTMSEEIHKLIIDKVSAWNAPIEIISHAGMGEPLLDTNIEQKIIYEKQVFPKAMVAVYSNVSALNEKRAGQILDSGVDVLSVSLNGYSKEVYEAVMNLSFERTQQNLDLFIKMNNERGHPIEINVSLVPTQHHDKSEVENFCRYWEGKVDAVVVPPYIGWGGFFDLGIKKKQYPCRYIFEVLQIDWDGTVVMCCEDFESQYPLGNLTKQDPNEIFNSPKIQEQRRQMVGGNFSHPPICLDCIESHGVAREFWKRAEILPVS